MLLNGIIYDVIYLVNTDAIFTLNNANVEEFYFWDFLEVIVKESVKLLCESFNADYVLCYHEDIICSNSKELLVILLYPWEYRMIRGASDHFDNNEDLF